MDQNERQETVGLQRRGKSLNVYRRTGPKLSENPIGKCALCSGNVYEWRTDSGQVILVCKHFYHGFIYAKKIRSHGIPNRDWTYVCRRDDYCSTCLSRLDPSKHHLMRNGKLYCHLHLRVN